MAFRVWFVIAITRLANWAGRPIPVSFVNNSTSTLGKHAVVFVGSEAGLLSARVLADHFDRVTVLERDLLPERPNDVNQLLLEFLKGL